MLAYLELWMRRMGWWREVRDGFNNRRRVRPRLGGTFTNTMPAISFDHICLSLQARPNSHLSQRRSHNGARHSETGVELCRC